MKSVRIRSYSGPYFPAFGLNTEKYSVSLRIQSEWEKMRTRRTAYTDTFHAVDIKIPRKWFTEQRKQEMREHCPLTENYAETAKAFSLNELTVRRTFTFTIHDVKLSDKGNHSGAGRPLTYPKDVENELVPWILQLLD